jgi:hypothetical protein
MEGRPYTIIFATADLGRFRPLENIVCRLVIFHDFTIFRVIVFIILSTVVVLKEVLGTGVDFV